MAGEDNVHFYGEYYNPDIAKRIEVLEERTANFPEFRKQTENMLYWWKGNGSPGARDLMTRFVTEEYMERIVDYTVKQVLKEEGLREKSDRFRWIEVITAGGVFILAALEVVSRV